MRKTLLAAMAALLLSSQVMAGPATDALTACLADSTTGKDRKLLARWLFVAISAHPDMRDISDPLPSTRDSAYREAGVLFTRLLAESCAKEVRAARAAEGQEAVGKGFEYMGRLAMSELMTNGEVRNAFGAFDRYVDRRKLDAAIGAQ